LGGNADEIGRLQGDTAGEVTAESVILQSPVMDSTDPDEVTYRPFPVSAELRIWLQELGREPVARW